MIGIEFDNQQFKSSVTVTTQQMEKYFPWSTAA